MARILFGWDSGYGTGYVERLLMIADALAGDGHQPIFAIRDLIVSAPLLADRPYPVLQAPIAVGQIDPIEPDFRPSSFADLMAASNFNDPLLLMRLMQAWDVIFQATQPDLIVGEYAPLLSLAAHGRIPMIAMGHGYIMPPPHLERLPIFNYARKPFTDQEAILAAVLQVQAARGAPAPPNLPAILGGTAHFVTAFTETDPYASMRTQAAVGPLQTLGPLHGPPTQANFYAYLSADYRLLRMVIQGLVESGVPGSCYIKRLTPELGQFLSERGIAVYDRPPPLDQVAASASLIIHHGGTATLHSAFAAGRPQMLWPQVGDQRVTATTVDSMGLTVDGTQRLPTAGAIAQAIKRLIADSELSNRCIAYAQAVRRRGEHGSLARVLAAARQLVPAA